MHEWALAEGIMATAIEFAEKNGAERIEEIVIVLGELQDVDRDIVEFALNNLKKDTIAQDAKFVFEEEKALFQCRACGHRWGLDESKGEMNEEIREDIHFVPEVVHAFLSCPNCGSRDFEVVKGRGVYIREMKVR